MVVVEVVVVVAVAVVVVVVVVVILLLLNKMLRKFFKAKCKGSSNERVYCYGKSARVH